MVLVESNDERRHEITTALRAGGVWVLAVGRMAELEQWPDGEVVVTESSSFTPWWKHVGASHVVVLADTAALGMEACQLGASMWVGRLCAPRVLLAMLGSLGERSSPHVAVGADTRVPA